jgi:hypothetical protein
MSQHDYNIANGGGAAVRADLNNALLAVLSQNSGATAPAVTKPFMPWYDTTTGILKIRNSADNAWLTFADGAIENASIAQAKLAAGVAGNGPAFHARLGANQSVSSATTTKIAYDTEVLDTNGNYNQSTYRFQPTVAGYYQVNASLISFSADLTQLIIRKTGSDLCGSYPSTTGGLNISCLVYLNGSTDYIEAYVLTSANATLRPLGVFSYFQAAMIRSA